MYLFKHMHVNEGITSAGNEWGAGVEVLWDCPTGRACRSVQIIGFQSRTLFAIVSVCSRAATVAVSIAVSFATVLALTLERLFVPLLGEIAQQDASLVHHD